MIRLTRLVIVLGAAASWTASGPSCTGHRGESAGQRAPTATGGQVNPKQDKATVQQAIRLDLKQRKTRPPAAAFPRKNDEGAWRAPDGAAITLVFVVHRDRPPEQEGTPTTAYYSAATRTYWLHEGGGLSGYDAWFGPFRLERSGN